MVVAVVNDTGEACIISDNEISEACISGVYDNVEVMPHRPVTTQN
jgi:hypothetical protein